MRNRNRPILYVSFLSIFLGACGGGGSSSGVETGAAETEAPATEVAVGEAPETEAAESGAPEVEVAEAEDPQADLTVLSIALDPETPVQGEAVDVTVTIFNQSTVKAEGPFIVTWYGGEHYVDVGCLWNVAEGVNANSGWVMTCTYAGYPSWYPSINTMAQVDVFDAVDESNEENNTELMEITVIDDE